MHKTVLKLFLNSCSDNRKSKIENRKLVGIVALALTFVFGGVVAQAQQPTKIPRIGFLRLPPLSYRGPHRGIPARSARAWIRGGEKHCH